VAKKVTVRAIMPGDAEELFKNLRPADRDELMAMSGEVYFSIKWSIMSSRYSWAFEVDGELACLLGIVEGSLISRFGIPWMLGTTVLDKNVGVLIRHSRKYYEEVKGKYPHLVNFVDARNTKSIRWLKWLGFEFGEARDMGVANVPFYRFELRS
jgi:hypothetical protein